MFVVLTQDDENIAILIYEQEITWMQLFWIRQCQFLLELLWILFTTSHQLALHEWKFRFIYFCNCKIIFFLSLVEKFRRHFCPKYCFGSQVFSITLYFYRDMFFDLKFCVLLLTISFLFTPFWFLLDLNSGVLLLAICFPLSKFAFRFGDIHTFVFFYSQFVFHSRSSLFHFLLWSLGLTLIFSILQDFDSV